jgi:hypothetical protein
MLDDAISIDLSAFSYLKRQLALIVVNERLCHCGIYDFHVSMASSGSFQCLRPFITQSR